MAFLTNRVMALAASRHDRESFRKLVLYRSTAHRLRAAIEGVLLIAIFIVVSATALYLRARLGFAH